MFEIGTDLEVKSGHLCKEAHVIVVSLLEITDNTNNNNKKHWHMYSSLSITFSQEERRQTEPGG